MKFKVFRLNKRARNGMITQEGDCEEELVDAEKTEKVRRQKREEEDEDDV